MEKNGPRTPLYLYVFFIIIFIIESNWKCPVIFCQQSCLNVTTNYFTATNQSVFKGFTVRHLSAQRCYSQTSTRSEGQCQNLNCVALNAFLHKNSWWVRLGVGMGLIMFVIRLKFFNTRLLWSGFFLIVGHTWDFQVEMDKGCMSCHTVHAEPSVWWSIITDRFVL